MNPTDTKWASYVEAPKVLDGSPDEAAWDQVADVVIVGFGSAGAAAALEAREEGASVIAVDRFRGGGASRLSGGVYYAGATRYQRQAGFNDSTDSMFRYLKKETGDVVSDQTLRAYCETSSPNLDWLESFGVQYSSAVCLDKVHYPGEGQFLYYSGNERVPGYEVGDPPPPRGHRAVGAGFGGQYMYAAMEKAALDRGVVLHRNSPAIRLITTQNNAVVGVEVLDLSSNQSRLEAHQQAIDKVDDFWRWVPSIALRIGKKISRVEQQTTSRIRIRARKGVILAAGSYVWNRSMVKQYAPLYADAHPNGTLGCDGSGIRLGESVGGIPTNMDHLAAYRIIMPAEVGFCGIAVNSAGARFVAEDVYAAKLGQEITERQGGKGWLIFDRAKYVAARKYMWPQKGRSWFFQVFPLFMNLVVHMRRGNTLGKLAAKCGINPEGLIKTVAEYNAHVRTGIDPLGKRATFLSEIGSGPYYAVDLRVDNPAYPCITLAMGGLKVKEETGQVLREDGSVIAGLYAAGRTAVGIPSNNYVSGMAIGDCIFSGRRAGASAAANGGLKAGRDTRWTGAERNLERAS